MECQEFKDHIFAYCDGSLPSGQQAKFTLHLEKCDSCRQYHNFTLLETELLADGDDVPALPSSFTSRVMQGLETAGLPKSPDPEPLEKSRGAFSPRPRFGLATAAAVVLALIIMSPQYLNEKQVADVAMNEAPALQRELAPAYLAAPGSSIASVSSQDSAINETAQSGVPKLGTVSEPNIPVAPSTSVEEQKLASSTPESASEAPATSAPVATKNVSAPALVSGSVSDMSVPAGAAYAPENIPEQFKLVAVDAHGSNQTVYSYTDASGEASLQLELVVSDSSGSGDVSGSVFNRQNEDRLYKDFYFTNIKVTVYFSGSMPAAQLESLVKTISVVPLSNVR